MSKAVTNAEIEDVLSSIRRLVSENATAHRRDKPGAEARDRLVLTPAFRVDDSVEDAAEAPEAEALAGEADSAPAPQVETRADDVDAAVEILSERLAAANIIPETAPVVASETPETAEKSVADAMAQAAEDRSLERRIAELEAAVDNTADEWEPDGSEVQDMPDEVIFHHHAAPKAGRAPAETEPEPTPAPAPDVADEAALADADEDDAPTDAEDDAPFLDTDAWEDVMVTRPDDAHAFGGDDIGGIDDAEVLEEESVIDEALLREYVAQLVREELQGPIGERITHNVRRMVRREIARALALRDLD